MKSNYLGTGDIRNYGVGQSEEDEVECKRCHGLGEDADGADCVFCGGMGSVFLR